MIFVGVNKFGDLFVMSGTQRNILNSIEVGFKAGEKVRMENFYKGEWDKVCLVPAYSFNSLRSEDAATYLGESLFPLNVWLIPDPGAAYYGLGFSFLRDGKLVKFLRIPKARFIFFKDGEFIDHEPVTIEYRVNDTSEKTGLFYLGEMDVSQQEKGTYCYKRSTAFIELIDGQHLYIGEQK